MNTLPSPTTLNPLVRILILIRRLAAAALPLSCSLGLLDRWTRESIAERNTAAERALAIDDPIERIRQLIDVALQNDDPRLRRKILHAIDEVHERTEAQSAALRIQLPLPLQDPLPH